MMTPRDKNWKSLEIELERKSSMAKAGKLSDEGLDVPRFFSATYILCDELRNRNRPQAVSGTLPCGHHN